METSLSKRTKRLSSCSAEGECPYMWDTDARFSKKNLYYIQIGLWQTQEAHQGAARGRGRSPEETEIILGWSHWSTRRAIEGQSEGRKLSKGSNDSELACISHQKIQNIKLVHFLNSEGPSRRAYCVGEGLSRRAYCLILRQTKHLLERQTKLRWLRMQWCGGRKN